MEWSVSEDVQTDTRTYNFKRIHMFEVVRDALDALKAFSVLNVKVQILVDAHVCEVMVSCAEAWSGGTITDYISSMW